MGLDGVVPAPEHSPQAESYHNVTLPEQISTAVKIEWEIIGKLRKAVEEDSEEKWLAVEHLPKFLSLFTRQVQLLKDLIRESKRAQETRRFQQAVLDVLAEADPLLRQRVIQRIEELETEAAEGKEEPKRPRGRPTDPLRERLI